MSLYKQEILDHYKHPRCFGRLENFTHTTQLVNASCGDEIEMTLQVSDKGILEDIKFTGSGCAISIASASMLSEQIKGNHISDILDLKPEKILSSLGMGKESPRIKCALLSWECLGKAIKLKRPKE